MTTANGIRLIQQPVAELAQLRKEHHTWRAETITANNNLLAEISGETLEIIAEFQIADLEDADRFGFHLRTGTDEVTTVGYAVKGQQLYVDRSQSGEVSFNDNFAGVQTAVMEPINNTIKFHIFIDRSSVELFGNGCLVSFTEQIFPSNSSLGLDLFVDGKLVQLNALDIYTLKPATFLISDKIEASEE
jgi:sucrose-6-phosphate hydrolase SacC (GH32 family)